MTNSQKNNAFTFALLFAIFLPMILHIIHYALNGIYSPDLFYKVIYAPVVLWIIWAAPQGKIYLEIFPETEDEAQH